MRVLHLADRLPDPTPDVHLDATERRRLVELDGTHAQVFEWLAHLVACRPCRRRLARDFPVESRRILERFPSPVPDLPAIHSRAYDRTMDRILGKLVDESERLQRSAGSRTTSSS